MKQKTHHNNHYRNYHHNNHHNNNRCSHCVLLAVTVLILTLLCSCNTESIQIHYALKAAGSNRSELKSVLKHYRTVDPDQEKLAAARYLIANMPAHYSYADTSVINSYYRTALDILGTGPSPDWQRDTLRQISDTRYAGIGRNVVSDVEIITASYLIRNIDHAFETWRTRPWTRHITFDEFKEKILPYKVTELQSFDDWRSDLSAYYSDSLSKVPCHDVQGNSLYGAMEIVRSEIHAKQSDIGLRVIWEDRGAIPLRSAETWKRMTFGSCLEYVTMGTAVFRSMGMPAVIDKVPSWGRNSDGHSWYAFVSDNGVLTPTMNSLIVGAGMGFYPYERVPKIWRSTYTMNREVVKYRNTAKYVHPFDICREDVTDLYYRTSDIKIDVLNDVKIKDRYVYIAMASFTPNGPQWNILDFGRMKWGKACFKKMGRNMLYMALGYDGTALVPISSPFILHRDGSIEYLQIASEDAISTGNIETVDMELRRKYYESYNVVDMRRRILGAEIQCANRPDFSDAVTLFTIDTTAIPYKIPLQADKPYRYWRYLSAGGTYGSIAELKFFDETGSSITGTPIACDSAKADAITAAFDDNLLSNFETEQPDGNWVGMDMKRAVRISAVSISPRSDDNDICPGCEYELFCWDGKRWKSLGYRLAEGNTIYYDNLPCNCLLWLRNYTRGTNERPFIIRENNHIEWW